MSHGYSFASHLWGCCLVMALLPSLLFASFCKDEDGNNTDWWFLSKLPTNIPRNLQPTSQFAFNYYFYNPDATPAPSPVTQFNYDLGKYTLSSALSPVGRTLSEVYAGSHPSPSWTMFAYNDQPPGSGSKSTYGHLKGILTYNDATREGYWLIHTVPRFPDTKASSYAWTGSPKCGQSFVCISFNSKVQFDSIANQLLFMKPWIYDEVESSTLTNTPSVQQLHNRSWEYGYSEYSVTTPAGRPIIHYARNVYSYLYYDFVSYKTGLSGVWETWRRSPKNLPFCTAQGCTYNEINVQNLTVYINGGYQIFRYTKDHSKIGYLTDSTSGNPTSIVCIGDINRMESQKNRGGGTACINDANLASRFINTFTTLQACMGTVCTATVTPSLPPTPMPVTSLDLDDYYNLSDIFINETGSVFDNITYFTNINIFNQSFYDDSSYSDVSDQVNTDDTCPTDPEDCCCDGYDSLADEILTDYYYDNINDTLDSFTSSDVEFTSCSESSTLDDIVVDSYVNTTMSVSDDTDGSCVCSCWHNLFVIFLFGLVSMLLC